MANHSLNQRTFITVEFALALPDIQKIEAQKFQEGITLKEAMPFFSLFHEANKIIEAPQYGVFNIKVEEDYILKDGDRIEVYRPLIIDPKKPDKFAQQEIRNLNTKNGKRRKRSKRSKRSKSVLNNNAK